MTRRSHVFSDVYMQQHQFTNWEACASTEHALTRPHAISKELCAGDFRVKPPEQVCLTEEEIEKARMAFLEFDKDNNGSIDQFELKEVLEEMGIKLSDADIFQMMHDADEDNSGAIEFQEFLRVMKNQKITESMGDGGEILAAYVACGGNVDKTGHVDRNVISKIIKVDFGLHIDIDKMMDAVDKDGSGEMEFEEFQFLLSGKAQIC